MTLLISVSFTASMACFLFRAAHWLDLRHRSCGIVGSILGVQRSIVLLRHCTQIMVMLEVQTQVVEAALHLIVLLAGRRSQLKLPGTLTGSAIDGEAMRNNLSWTIGLAKAEGGPAFLLPRSNVSNIMQNSA